MNDALFALGSLLVLFAGTGISAIFWGPQIRAWLGRKEAEVKAAYSARVRPSQRQ